MDRRDFLAGLGHAAAAVAAAAQGCEGEAAEQPDIARGDVPRIGLAPVGWFASGTPDATSHVERFADGSGQCVVHFDRDAFADGAWPAGTVPVVERFGPTLVLIATWSAQDGPWIGRQLRRRGDRIEQYVFGEGTWEPVGGA